MSNVKIYVSKKTLGIILAVCLAILAFTAYMGIGNTIKYNNFVPVDAVIMKIGFNGKGGHGSCKLYLKYEYDGKEYTSKKELRSVGDLRTGDTITIRCNPNNPYEINDDYGTSGYIIVSCFLAVFSVGLIIGMAKGKPSRKVPVQDYPDYFSAK